MFLKTKEIIQRPIWCTMLKQAETLIKAANAPKKGERIRLVLKKEAQETPRINGAQGIAR
jgi:hypothetical protein